MRVHIRVAQVLGNRFDKAVRDGMFQVVRLVMHLMQTVAEFAHQVEFHQPVTAQDFEGFDLACRGEGHATIFLIINQPDLFQPLGHISYRGRGDAQYLGQRVGGYAVAALLQHIDRLQEVLNGFRFQRIRSVGHVSLLPRHYHLNDSTIRSGSVQ